MRVRIKAAEAEAGQGHHGLLVITREAGTWMGEVIG